MAQPKRSKRTAYLIITPSPTLFAPFSPEIISSLLFYLSFMIFLKRLFLAQEIKRKKSSDQIQCSYYNAYNLFLLFIDPNLYTVYTTDISIHPSILELLTRVCYRFIMTLYFNTNFSFILKVPGQNLKLKKIPKTHQITFRLKHLSSCPSIKSLKAH